MGNWLYLPQETQPFNGSNVKGKHNNYPYLRVFVRIACHCANKLGICLQDSCVTGRFEVVVEEEVEVNGAWGVFNPRCTESSLHSTQADSPVFHHVLYTNWSLVFYRVLKWIIMVLPLPTSNITAITAPAARTTTFITVSICPVVIMTTATMTITAITVNVSAPAAVTRYKKHHKTWNVLLTLEAQWINLKICY